jgi:hypothetical protein
VDQESHLYSSVTGIHFKKLKAMIINVRTQGKKKRSMKPPKNNNNSPAIDQIQGESMKLLK